MSLNPAAYARHEAGTRPVAARPRAMRRMPEAGYRIGLTIASIIAAERWELAYAGLIRDATQPLGGLDPDPSIELITHRYTATSKEVLTSWHPSSDLDMSGARRAERRTKFGSVKQVYATSTMAEVRRYFEREVADTLPTARTLYFT